MRRRSILIFALVWVMFTASSVGAGRGTIKGRVGAEDGRGYGGVRVSIQDSNRTTVTDSAGRFSFQGLDAGSYTLVFVQLEESLTRPGVVVTAGETTTVDLESGWPIQIGESLTVYGASRRQERVIDAPAAVTVIDEEQIQRQASHGQLPKILEFTPGAEVTQSGIYDYNFNTRGFNSSLNRRVATLVDGRDSSVPFLGAQQWGAMPALDDLAGLELLRGPSAALYGANASSGVLNIATLVPRDSQGGTLRVVAGELNTTNLDFRYAGALGKGWYFKVNASVRDHGEFNVSRNFDFETGTGRAEYSVPCSFPSVPGETDCLPQEAVPLSLDDDQILSVSTRVDKYMSGGDLLTLELGTTDIEARATAQTGTGRFQIADDNRPWARINYSKEHWNFLAYYTGRDGDELTALASGTNVVLHSDRYAVEIQTHWDFAGERGRIVGGASYVREEIDSLDPGTGAQSLMFEPVDSDHRALFAQLDYQASRKIKLVFSGRWDDSTLYDSRFSPKASLVYSINPAHSLRATYNQAFQVANYSELFLRTPAVAPSQFPDLGALQGICDVASVDCGFGITPILALGNETLDVEETTVFEVGYSGIISGRAFLTLDYYQGKNENFISDLLFQLNPISGARTNPNFGPWEGPEGLPDVLEQAVRDAAAANLPPVFELTNAPDGSNIIAGVSYTNIGQVDSQGVELGLQYLLNERWKMHYNYAWFDFDLVEAPLGLADQLLPNTPEHQTSLGLFYSAGRIDGSLSGRWVDEFRWVVGPFQGDVESYTTVDLGGNYRFNDNWQIGFNVANLLDNEHWESFGGDLLARRALAHVVYRWE